MPHKLNLSKFVPPPPPPPPGGGSPAVNRYASPVRWWKVTTEGDIEGRTTLLLGVYFGHLAEIAFELASKAAWALEFTPTEGAAPPVGLERVARKPTAPVVCVQLDVQSGTWELRDEQRLAWWRRWLDTDDISVHGEDPRNRNRSYAGVYLRLRQ